MSRCRVLPFPHRHSPLAATLCDPQALGKSDSVSFLGTSLPLGCTTFPSPGFHPQVESDRLLPAALPPDMVVMPAEFLAAIDYLLASALVALREHQVAVALIELGSDNPPTVH